MPNRLGELVQPQSVTQTFAVLAVRGAGKTNTARVMAEQMYDLHLPFVAIDPVGSWWGLRASRDGATPGLSIPVFGGRHGDIPLDVGAATLLADLIVDRRLSCVLDLSTFSSESEKKKFLLVFAQRLYLNNQDPLHLFLEEADDYCLTADTVTPSMRKLLGALAQYPDGMETNRLAALSGYTVNGHFNNMLGSLRTMGLITPPRQPIKAMDYLFEE